jgi:RimJ/RimL family protein N-acetyltransferase
MSKDIRAIFLELQKQYRVYLRALELNDANESCKWRADDEINSSIVGKKYFVSSEYEKKWVHDAIFNPSNTLKLAVCDKEKSTYIGNVYLTEIDSYNQNAQFSKLLGSRDFWGKGLATEFTMLMLYHAFYELNLQRVYAYQLVTNKASMRVNEKCGFRNEGTLRKAAFKHGELVDLNVMGILKEDFDLKVLTEYQLLSR